jgi:hypothetical protein
MRPARAREIDRDAATLAPPPSGTGIQPPSPSDGIDRSAMTERPPESSSKRPTNPASAQAGRTTDVPSARPTSVPDFDLSALADADILPQDQGWPFPPDLSVPLRTGPAPEGLDLRTAFLLLHVDGTSTVAQIATSSALPFDEVMRGIVRLIETGAVELRVAEPPVGLSESGVFTCSPYAERKRA